MILKDFENKTKKYGIVLSDPPWPQQKGGLRTCRPKQGKKLDYGTCPMEEIIGIHKRAFELCDDKCNIFIWTIDKFLPETEKFMREMGYRLHARMVWDKGNGVAPAFTVRFAHEYLLWFYKKGKMLKPRDGARGKYSTVVREAATVHSHKPVAVYRMIDDMFPGVNKLELFARNEKTGWDSWGNQVGILEKVV